MPRNAGTRPNQAFGPPVSAPPCRPRAGIPSQTATPPAAHMVTVICDALNRVRSQGRFCRKMFASAVLIETIHMVALGPHSNSAARFEVEAMLVVPPPDSVDSHRVSDTKQMSVHAT